MGGKDEGWSSSNQEGSAGLPDSWKDRESDNQVSLQSHKASNTHTLYNMTPQS